MPYVLLHIQFLEWCLYILTYSHVYAYHDVFIQRTSAEKKQISVSKRHLWNDMTFDDDDAVIISPPWSSNFPSPIIKISQTHSFCLHELYHMTAITTIVRSPLFPPIAPSLSYLLCHSRSLFVSSSSSLSLCLSLFVSHSLLLSLSVFLFFLFSFLFQRFTLSLSHSCFLALSLSLFLFPLSSPFCVFRMLCLALAYF